MTDLPLFRTDFTPESFNDLSRRCFLASASKGWWDNERIDETKPVASYADLDAALVFDQAPDKIALIHSELSEACEDARIGRMTTTLREDGKPEGFFSELADVAIRIFDLLGAGGVELSGKRERLWASPRLRQYMYGRPLGALATIHSEVSTACAELLDSVEDAAPALVRTVLLCEELCRILGANLQHEIERKLAYNATRSYRHGGKLA